MKYTIISAHCTERAWEAQAQKDINAALANAKHNYIELTPALWVFKSVGGCAGYTLLADALRHHQTTFVQLAFDFPAVFFLPPKDLLKLQQFLNS